MQNFLRLFNFRPDLTFFVGVERERFVVNQDGLPVPLSEQVLNLLPNDGHFGYELSACQLEDRIGPITIDEVRNHLIANDKLIHGALSELGLRDLLTEVAPEDMDLTVFNDPTGRYQKIVKQMPEHILRAACRVAATHVHVGMPSLETALVVYNAVIDQCDSLCQLINHSGGQRLDIYKTMAPDFRPRPYDSIEDFYADAVTKGFDKDPRKNWQLIRMTIHGTIEFRMGGSTSSHDEVVHFAQACRNLCMEALQGSATATA